MAYQQSDLDLLHSTLITVATGPQEVQFADGRKTKFQTVEAVVAAIAVVDTQLKIQAQKLPSAIRRRIPYYRSGL